jgi:hypothetical protein
MEGYSAGDTMTLRLLFATGVVGVLSLLAVAAHEAPRAAKASRSLVSAPVYYSRGVLIASNKAGTAAVEFTASHDDGSFDYRFRYRPSDRAKKEQTGMGSVSPVAPKPADRPTTKTGDSGETKDDIVAGDLALLWGKGGKDWGWVHYVPEDMTIQMVFIDFTTMDLARFQK